MALRYAIHPAVGIARVGNSPDEFYLAPETIGGLPVACDEQGNAVLVNGQPQPVAEFKDAAGRIKRQGAGFKIIQYDDAAPGDVGREVTLSDSNVAGIEWTVHLANKKAAWYQFQELEGNLLLGPENSYAARNVPLRNASVTSAADRQKLIIDPGPRTLAGAGQRAAFSQETIPPEYTHGSFPPAPSQGYAVTTLGDMLTDAEGRLVVLGGFGNAGGNQPIATFAGADTWHDDIADGPVACRLTLTSGEAIEMTAWVLVGSPKFAPELVNIVSLDDLMFDVAVRDLGLVPEMYDKQRWPDGWNPEYVASFTRDIEPIMRRPADYRWVANVPVMQSFAMPPFDPRDTSEATRGQRAAYFSYFRRPGDGPERQDLDLFGPAGIPMLPDNSGSNSVSNSILDKFLTLTETQYFLLGQWSRGYFSNDTPAPLPGVHPLDQASVGNAVGAPMCPGIEVTWSLRNPAIYSQPFRIAHRHDEQYYFENGLSPSIDETEGGGCEPGDLTKRMAIPWQADFFQCTMQYVNFTDPNVNKVDGIPAPPTYYAYWWPPQSPMHVLNGALDIVEQQLSGNPLGVQVYYPRGINSFSQMITAWSYMGFILNLNTSPERTAYPYFVERERNHGRFHVASVAVGAVSNVLTAEDVIFMPVFYLKEEALAEAKLESNAAPQRTGEAIRGPAHRRMHL